MGPKPKRYQQQRCLHFIRFSCYRRMPLLDSVTARETFECELERVRRWYGCYVAGAVALSPDREMVHEHDAANHMAGLVLGINVAGERLRIATHGRVRKLRLLVRERPAVNGVAAGFGYQLEEAHKAFPSDVSLPVPTLVLERGRPVEITVVNQLAEPHICALAWDGVRELLRWRSRLGNARSRSDADHRAGPVLLRPIYAAARRHFYLSHAPGRRDSTLWRVVRRHGCCRSRQEIRPQCRTSICDQRLGRAQISRQSNSDLRPAKRRPAARNSALACGTESSRAPHQHQQRDRWALVSDRTRQSGALARSSKRRYGSSPNQAIVQDAKLTIAPGETYDFEYQPSHAGTNGPAGHSSARAGLPAEVVEFFYHFSMTRDLALGICSKPLRTRAS